LSPYNAECNNASINLEIYIFFKNDASNHNKKNMGIDKTIYKIPGYLDILANGVGATEDKISVFLGVWA
jgi:hypothetical protein